MHLEIYTYNQNRTFSLIHSKQNLEWNSVICINLEEFIQKGIIEEETLIFELPSLYYFILILRWFENIDNCCKLDNKYGVYYAEKCHTQLQSLLPDVAAYFNDN